MNLKKLGDLPDSGNGACRQAWFDSLVRLLSAIDNGNEDPEQHTSDVLHGRDIGERLNGRAELSEGPPDVQEPAES